MDWKNIEDVRAYRRRVRKNEHLREKYGITLEQKTALWEQQNKVCAACLTPISLLGKKGAQVDHDHVTKRVRGLLCFNCNVALGLLDDSVERLQNLRAYLTKK